MSTYLDFEKSIKEIEEQIELARIKGDDEGMKILSSNLDSEIQKTYKNLNDYQTLQLARHPDRPYALDYVRMLMSDYYEIHGDRAFKDDLSIIAYVGYIDEQKVIVIGEQKGRGTKNKLKRNFGMPNPEGYRKALRVAKMAEKFNLPILFLIDTPGAYPGIGAEERGQSEAIARNLFEFSNLKVPTVSIVIGEGGSGGALAIGVSDRFAMLRNAVFSVISPEGCAAILWNDPSKQEAATKAMKITAKDLYKYKLIDDIIDEPLQGAHRKKEECVQKLKEYFLTSLEELAQIDDETRLENRYTKLTSVGAFSE